jgi:alanyl-tRNA synthetase
MATELAYLADPFQLEFQANVIGKTTLPDGRRGIILPRTYFYPTGGGQEHDTGILGDVHVIDVMIDDAGTVIHVVDREVDGSDLPARIDRARRMAFMQHHSGQHLLSKSIDETLNLETLSAKISIDSPSTIDLPASDLVESEFARAEMLANSIVYEDREIRSYIIPEEQIPTIPFRRAPLVHGQIRVVEIKGFDYSACGGTHCTRTGMIGIVKILRLERRGDRFRVHFSAGSKAFECFQTYASIVSRAGHLLTTNAESIVQALEHQQKVLHTQAKELEDLKVERLGLEARRLADASEAFDSIRLVTAIFSDRPTQQLRALAMHLQHEPGVVALLATHAEGRVTVTVTCAADTGVSANDLLRRHLAEIGGRGGGDARLAQGGGNASEGAFSALFTNTKEYIRMLRK